MFINSLSIDYVDKAPKSALYLTFFDGYFFISRYLLKRTYPRSGTKTLFHIIHNSLCGQSSTFALCNENDSRKTHFMLTALISSEPQVIIFPEHVTHVKRQAGGHLDYSLRLFRRNDEENNLTKTFTQNIL